MRADARPIGRTRRTSGSSSSAVSLSQPRVSALVTTGVSVEPQMCYLPEAATGMPVPSSAAVVKLLW